MKKVVLLSLICVLLCACAATPQAPALAETDFTAELVFTLDGIEYAARYTRDAGGEALAFSAPESLCGMTAVRGTDGAVTVTIGDLTYVAEAVNGMFAFARLFSMPRDALRYVSETDGVRRFSGSDGADSCTLYTDTDGLPLRLCGTVGGREYDIQVLDFDERSDPQ